tara:strand:+ start:532 stop:735 length:204 start_codon:yes stop_codon:yes gene_type:complete
VAVAQEPEQLHLMQVRVLLAVVVVELDLQEREGLVILLQLHRHRVMLEELRLVQLAGPVVAVAVIVP